MKIYLLKAGSCLVPHDQAAEDYLRKVKVGAVLSVDIKQPRNYKFHKKYYALLNFLYDHWEPEVLEDPRWKGIVPEKSFDRFRADIQILAGHYEAKYRIDGSVRIESKSVSFARMTDKSFEELYSAVIDVGLKHILVGYDDADQVDRVVMELIQFT